MLHDTRLHQRRRRLIHAFGGGAYDVITSIFADGTDGFYFDFSKTDRLFQETTGVTPSDDAGENIALALESHSTLWCNQTLAGAVAGFAELRALGEISNLGSPGTLATYTPSTGVGTAARTDSSNTSGVRIPATAGKVYVVDIEKTGGAGALNIRTGNAGGVIVVTVTTRATYRFSLSSGTGVFIACATNGATVDFTLHSVKEIPGNHGLQATISAQPKWQTGGLARFDGSDDYLLSPLTTSGATAVTLAAKVKVGASGAVRAILGGGTGDRLRLSFDASGQLGAGIGGHGEATIFRSGSLVGQTGVGVVTADGSTVKLYWNGVEAYSAAQLAGFVTTIPIAVGCYNNTGTPTQFFNSDIYHALAIKKALTAAQIAAITNLWGTS